MSLVTFPRQYLADINGVPRVGAKAFFYQSGTTTSINVYTSNAFSVAHTQPVLSSASGLFPAVYVNPAVNSTFKIVIQDANDVTIYTDDNIPALSMSQAEIGAALYPRTAAEIAASVTPSNYAYPPGDVRRYGAVVNGVTNDAGAIQAAINVQASGGSDVILPPGRMLVSTGLTFGSNVKIIGSGNKSSILVVGSGTAISVLRAANTAAFNDGAVFEDFGILFANSADIGINLTSVSRCVMRSVRIWGDEAQVAVRGTGVLFDAATASSYANSLIDCDIRNCTRGLHLRNAANANFAYGGQIINCGEGVYQEGTGANRIDNCAFFGTRIECTAGACLHLTGHVWGFAFYGCRFEAYNSGSRCVEIDGGDATLPPTVFVACTVGTSGGAVDYDLSAMTGRILILGQDANQFTGLTGTGTFNTGLGTLAVGNPSGAGQATITTVSLDTNADLVLAAKGTGIVKSAGGFQVTGATPTGTGSQVSFGNTTQTTVGAAGGGSALPATPVGYLQIDIGGTKYKLPYFNN